MQALVVPVAANAVKATFQAVKAAQASLQVFYQVAAHAAAVVIPPAALAVHAATWTKVAPSLAAVPLVVPPAAVLTVVVAAVGIFSTVAQAVLMNPIHNISAALFAHLHPITHLNPALHRLFPDT